MIYCLRFIIILFFNHLSVYPLKRHKIYINSVYHFHDRPHDLAFFEVMFIGRCRILLSWLKTSRQAVPSFSKTSQLFVVNKWFLLALLVLSGQ